ncbi:uncharacterized protein LOC117175023 isoform X2 [Belonocnema kinseyi]|uniref:uncharacterized protein LOC117175023 isoform X2 n=1 Tax=Belonocnema kinseyi TaxID=2817044 RepID=UPI00143DB7A5|nr:uncharacterized protein LOC117175023 isoform X2 [Belonocnema kinseyi]
MVASIDDAQTATVEEHFNELMNDNSYIATTGWNVAHDDLPAWYDADLFKKAQAYYNSHILGFTIAQLMGLIDVLAVPSILKVLIFTKKSGIPCTAFKRYAMTVLHTHAILSEDIEDPKSKFFSSINTIRWKHCMATKLCQKANHPEITNRDLALTQFGFFGYILIRPKEFGFEYDPDKQAAIVHFWRVIGHLIDIPDRLNICRKNLAETTQLCKIIMQEVMTKHVIENPPHFREMASAMLEAIACIDFTTDVQSSLAFCHQLHGAPYEKLSLLSWLNLKYHEMIFFLCRTPIIGYFTKSFQNFMIKTTFWIIDGYPLIAWFRFGKAETRFVLYPHIPS